MPRSYYDLLPPEVRAKYPPESLDLPAARVLLKPGTVPDDYDQARAAEAGRMLGQILPRMTQMRSMTNIVRAAQQGKFISRGGGGTWDPDAGLTEAARTLMAGKPSKPTEDVHPIAAENIGRRAVMRQKTTQELYHTIPTPEGRAIAQAAGTFIQQGAPNISPLLPPDRQYSTTVVPPPEGPAEHVAALIGGLGGFMTQAALLRGVGVGQATAAGGVGLLQEGTVKERLIRAATLGTVAKGAHIAGTAIAGTRPTVARAVAAQVPGAVGFGSIQPDLAAVMHRLTGEPDYPIPTGWDRAKGSGEMLIVNLMLGGRGIAGAAAARQRLTPAQQRHAEFVARAIQPPPGMTPEQTQVSLALSRRLNNAMGGREVFLNIPGEQGVRGRALIRGVVAYRMPDGTERIHLLVSDPANRAPVPVTFNSGMELVEAIGPMREGAPRGVEIAPGELERRPLRLAQDQQARGERLTQLDQRLEHMERNRPGKGDKGYRRWAQRVARLEAERDALRGSATPEAAPSPAPSARGTSAAKPREKGPAVKPGAEDADLDLFSERPEGAVPAALALVRARTAAGQARLAEEARVLKMSETEVRAEAAKQRMSLQRIKIGGEVSWQITDEAGSGVGGPATAEAARAERRVVGRGRTPGEAWRAAKGKPPEPPPTGGAPAKKPPPKPAPAAGGAPTMYRQSTGREIPIRAMAGPHLLNAERKTEPGPLKDALRGEIARRGLTPRAPGESDRAPARPKGPAGVSDKDFNDAVALRVELDRSQMPADRTDVAVLSGVVARMTKEQKVAYRKAVAERHAEKRKEATGGPAVREPERAQGTAPQPPTEALPALEDFMPRSRAELVKPKSGSEEDMYAAAVENRNRMTEPAEWKRAPVGTWAKDRDGDLWELVEVRLDDPRLNVTEAPGKPTVEKYAEWAKGGSELPPIKAIETEKGNLNVTDGNHRIGAAKALGHETIKAWVARTVMEDHPSGVNMPRGMRETDPRTPYPPSKAPRKMKAKAEPADEPERPKLTEQERETKNAAWKATDEKAHEAWGARQRALESYLFDSSPENLKALERAWHEHKKLADASEEMRIELYGNRSRFAVEKTFEDFIDDEVGLAESERERYAQAGEAGLEGLEKLFKKGSGNIVDAANRVPAVALYGTEPQRKRLLAFLERFKLPKNTHPSLQENVDESIDVLRRSLKQPPPEPTPGGRALDKPKAPEIPPELLDALLETGPDGEPTSRAVAAQSELAARVHEQTGKFPTPGELMEMVRRYNVAHPPDLPPAEQQAESRFQGGEKVRVPNEAIRRNDKRKTVIGQVIGHKPYQNADGTVEPGVLVAARRGGGKGGKWGWTEHHFPERRVVKLPTAETRAASKAQRTEKAKNLRESIRAEIAGDPRKGTAMMREQQEQMRQLLEGLPFEEQNNPQEPRVRRAWQALQRSIDLIGEVRAEAVRADETRALEPEVSKAFRDRDDAHAWTEPLREAVEDYPKHFTPARQRDILARAARGEIPTSSELRMALEHERELAEAGVSPAEAAQAADATAVIRRYIAHERENPLYSEAEAETATAWAEKLIEPSNINTPTKLARALADFEARVEPSPADDVPAGMMGGEGGFLALPRLHERLARLREVPRRFREAVRAIPRADRPRVVDTRTGATVNRFRDLFERDRFTESAWSRFVSAFVGGKFARPTDILTVEQQLEHKAIAPAEVGHFGRLTDGWQRALAGRSLDAFSGLSQRVAGVMNGEASAASLPPAYRDLPRELEMHYHEMRQYRNREVEPYGIEPIYSFGVRKVEYPVSPQDGHTQWRVQKERDGRRIEILNRHQVEVVGETEGGDLIVNTRNGVEPLTRYGGPHIIMSQMAESAVPLIESLLGRRLQGDERIELRDRFAGMRLSSESQVKDAAIQFELYRDMTARYLARVPFLHRVASDITRMRATGDPWRAGLLEAWIQAQMFQRRGSFDRMVDGAMRTLMYSRRPFAGHSIDRTSAAHWATQSGGSLPMWAQGFFSVPREAVIQPKEGQLEILATNAHGDRLVASRTRAPIDVREPELRAGFQFANRIKALSWAKVAEMGKGLPTGVTRGDFQKMVLRKYRHEALLNYRNPGNIFYRGLGLNTLRAYLGMNPRSLLANFLQPALTLAPEIGYRRALLASIAGFGSAGRRGAERIGTLQGEVRRLQEAAGGMDPRRNFHPLLRMVLSTGPLSPFRFSEDYTRGVAFLAARSMAERLGIPMQAAVRATEAGSMAYYANQLEIARAIRQKGTGESLAALLDTRTMYDYDNLGRPPIFGSGVGRLFGTLSTFTTNAIPELVLRPAGGAAKVAGAAARGIGHALTGGVIPRARPGATGGEGERRFVRRSGPTGADYNRWLADFGANEYAQRDAMMFLKQSIASGVVLGLTAATGVNFALGGTPGHEIIVLQALRWLFGKDERIDAALKAAYSEAQRSAVWDPQRGVAVSPIAEAVVNALRGQGDPAEAARMQLPMKSVLVRYLQNRQDSDRLREGGDLYWLARTLGIKSVTPSSGAGEEVLRNLGLQSRKAREAHRFNTRKPKPRAKSKPSTGIIGALMGQPQAGAA